MTIRLHGNDTLVPEYDRLVTQFALLLVLVIVRLSLTAQRGGRRA